MSNQERELPIWLRKNNEGKPVYRDELPDGYFLEIGYRILAVLRDIVKALGTFTDALEHLE
jgi:hypothetical protein